MKKTIAVTAFIVGILANSALSIAQDLIVYPQKGQAKEQQEKDNFACYGWAKDQTGFDPMQTPTASAPPPAPGAPKGGVVKGAARGALVGTAVGAIAGDAGKGAAIGAASGGLVGGMRKRDQAAQQSQAEQQWAQDQSNQYAAQRNTYNRAYAACMEGRGYTVK
jgi:hypothetical protein